MSYSHSFLVCNDSACCLVCKRALPSLLVPICVGNHPSGQIEQGAQYYNKILNLLNEKTVSGESSGRANLRLIKVSPSLKYDSIVSSTNINCMDTNNTDHLETPIVKVKGLTSETITFHAYTVILLLALASEQGNVIGSVRICVIGERSKPLSRVFNDQPRDIYIIFIPWLLR